MAPEKPIRRTSILLATALALSIAIIALQARYIRILQTDENGPRHDEIRVGVSVPQLDGLDSSGHRVLLSYGATKKPTLIYVFRPGCSWCERNSRAVDWLTTQVANRYRVIGLSLSEDGLGDFLVAHPMHFPIYRSPSPSITDSYRLQMTPETIVVSSAGIVLGAWEGAYMEVTKREIEKFFSVSLPDELGDPNESPLIHGN